MFRINSLLAPTTLLPVHDASAVGEVRRFARDRAVQLGFDETRCGQVAIVATELATNIARHAGAGAVLVRAQALDPSGILELLAIDRGPGMRDPSRCLEDGYSTRPGGSGTGLGAIRRLSDHFDLHTVHQLGTAVLARFGTPDPHPAPLDAAALSIPYPGEEACGDAWEIDVTPERCSFAVIDGLGHGM
ncbi:MAG TPA: anti-sigma regulatory factor, partial [Planctomycetota bacterium]|nr:anti-sigma regulatory factor [Planctomycetota bacterium]